MKLASMEITGWIAAVVVAVVIGLIVWGVSSATNDADFHRVLNTPIKDMTFGHVAGLLFIAWLLFK
jgi:hypothetical protein